MSKKQIEILERALQRERAARKQAEKILEDKSMELYEITEQLQKTNTILEEHISEKTSELKGVFENIVDAYVVIDLTGNVLKMNDAAIELLGFDVAIESFNLTDLVHKADVEYTVEAFNRLYVKGSFTNYQARIITKEGTIKLVHVNCSMIYNKQGKPIAAQGIVRDITQVTIDQEIIEEQKKQLDIIVDNSPLGIVLTADGHIIKANDTFQKLLDYSEEELFGRSIKELTYKDDFSETSQKINAMNSGEEDSFTIEKRYIRKNNSLLDAKTTVSAIKDNKGKIKYQVAMIEDITARLVTEKQKAQLLINLERSNKELREYAHMVSHDLKSPLRSIDALITWLKDDYGKVLDDQGLAYLKMLGDKIENMDHLIDGILKYSSINQDVLVQKEVDVNEVVSEITDTIYIPAHISIKVLNKLPTIKADKTRILQLFQNMISNAVNHIDKETGHIDIDCKSKTNEWLFSIRDNGKGIPKKYYKKIFKIFQSLGNEENSTGIGLSIVKKIIDLYQGTIWVDSELGSGTVFYFTLKK